MPQPQDLLRTFLIVLVVLSLSIPALGEASRGDVQYSGQVAVLMYHHVHETDRSSATLTPELFRGQLTRLQERGFHFITMDEFEHFLQGGAVPANAVLVTFDDGYQSYYRNAYPILKELDIPSVNFMITETLAAPLDSPIPFLSREEIKAMTGGSELVRAGCHTHALHNKSERGKPLLTDPVTIDGRVESEEEYRNRVLRDTQDCIQALNGLNGGDEPVNTMAYPYGAYDQEATRLVREAGIDYAFTIVPQMATRGADPLRIPRINAGSPNITPAKLEKAILRRVVAVPPSNPSK